MNIKLNKLAYCIEYFYAKPGCREPLIQSLLKLVEPTRAELGYLQYDLMQDSQDENLIILIVKFENIDLMRKHENQPFIKAFAENEMQQFCEKLIWNEGKGIE